MVKGKHLFNNQTLLLVIRFIYIINDVCSQSLKNQIFEKVFKEHIYQLTISAAEILTNPYEISSFWHVEATTQAIGKMAEEVLGVLRVV